MSLAQLKSAVKKARSETAEKNAISKILGKNPKLRTHKNGRKIMRTYLWENGLNGKSIALISGPSVEGEVFIVEEATSRTNPDKVLASFPHGKKTFVALQGRQNSGLPKRGMRTKTNRRGSAGVRYRSNPHCHCKRVNPRRTFNDHREFDTWAKRESKAGDVIVGMSVLVADGNGNFWLIGKGDKAVPELFDAAEAWVVTGEKEAALIATTDASIARNADKAVGEGFSGLQQTVAQYLGRRYGYKQERSIAKRAAFYSAMPQTQVEAIVEKVSEQLQEEANQAVEDLKSGKISKAETLIAFAKAKAVDLFKDDPTAKSRKKMLDLVVKSGGTDSQGNNIIKDNNARKAINELIQEGFFQNRFFDKKGGKGRPTEFFAVLGKVEDLPSELSPQEQVELEPVTPEAAEVLQDKIEEIQEEEAPPKPRKRRGRKPKPKAPARTYGGYKSVPKVRTSKDTGFEFSPIKEKDTDDFSLFEQFDRTPLYSSMSDLGLEEEDITFESEEAADQGATPTQDDQKSAAEIEDEEFEDFFGTLGEGVAL
jgi:hypothetical protein